MAGWLQNTENIGTGWKAPGDFQAAPIGELVKSILTNKLLRDKMTQENIADTIKNVRGERQSNAYLDAMKAAGLVPEDYEAGGVGGAKYGTGLAKMIQDKREADALEAYRTGMLGVSQGHLGVAQQRTQMAKDWADTAATEPETYTDPQGVTWRRTKSGWTPMPTGLQPTDVRTQNEHQILTEQAKLLEAKSIMDAEIASQREANIKALKPDVPYTRSDEYNRTVNRLKQIQQMKTAPSTDVSPPQAGGGAASNLAPGYGVDATQMSADDVRAAYKAGRMTKEEATARLKQLGFGD